MYMAIHFNICPGDGPTHFLYLTNLIPERGFVVAGPLVGLVELLLEACHLLLQVLHHHLQAPVFNPQDRVVRFVSETR